MAKVTAKVLDFSGVKDGGQFNRKRIPSGDYLAKIVKVEDAISNGDKKPMYLFSIKILKYPSAVYPYYTKLVENQLWKLRNIMIAGGKNVPKSKIKVDPNILVNKIIGVSIEDDEYVKDGETIEQSNIEGVFPASELADQPGATEEVLDDSEEEAEEDEDVSLDDDDLGTEDAAPADDEAEDEDEAPEEDEEAETEAADPYADMDRTALKAALKARDSSFVARKSQTDDDLRALLAAGGEETEEEEDEEPEPAPVAKRSTRKARPSASEVTDEELDELNIDDI